jgi:thiol-disulfide isomerase/thioredoxin
MNQYRSCGKILLTAAFLAGCLLSFDTTANSPPFSEKSGFLAEGIPFPPTIEDEHGKEFTPEDFKGKAVIIVFFTTWCPNCPDVLRALDNLQSMLKKEKVNGVEIIALNVGDDGPNELKLHYKTENVQLLKVYRSIPPSTLKGVKGVPACFVYDATGKSVCGYIGGGIPFESEKFIAWLVSGVLKN